MYFLAGSGAFSHVQCGKDLMTRHNGSDLVNDSELADERRDWQRLAENWPDGRIKLALTRALLGLRHAFGDLLQEGGYEPLAVSGPHADHVIAFARTLRRRQLVVAIARHFAPLTDGGRQWPAQWEGVIESEAKGGFEHLIGGARGRRTNTLSLAELFRDMPVCVLRGI